ncbi:unnamed protein product [Strongylus vulgaris]|uniref:Uncharacterized protein n=1 Tax=Strongylus vulgaris TaxID=40348 RepID=A0A3P7J1S1_STRVU|nr:unnamed protein product [Strongylus vulgaris]
MRSSKHYAGEGPPKERLTPAMPSFGSRRETSADTFGRQRTCAPVRRLDLKCSALVLRRTEYPLSVRERELDAGVTRPPGRSTTIQMSPSSCGPLKVQRRLRDFCTRLLWRIIQEDADVVLQHVEFIRIYSGPEIYGPDRPIIDQYNF